MWIIKPQNVNLNDCEYREVDAGGINRDIGFVELVPATMGTLLVDEDALVKGNSTVNPLASKLAKRTIYNTCVLVETHENLNDVVL